MAKRQPKTPNAMDLYEQADVLFDEAHDRNALFAAMDDLYDAKLKGKVAFLTELRDTVGLTMAAMGNSPADADMDAINDALDKIEGARDDDQARRAAKAVVNSPLVKTAVHGADPNWGRVVMAIGKLSDDNDIDQRAVSVRFGEAEVYPKPPDDVDLTALSDYMAGDEVLITVDLAIADGAWVVYGCDLTDGYVRINADYTT